jgi:hypothetical protein
MGYQTVDGFDSGSAESPHFRAQQNPVLLQRGLASNRNLNGLAELSLGDLPGLDAACAHPNPLRRAVHQSLYRLQIHVPPPPRHVVRVGNVIAKLRPFAANVAYLCHGSTPEFFGISCRRGRSSR